MNVLSLFSGIGGLELGLERAGMTVVGQVEIDPYCRRVLAKHWPEVPRHDDVRTAVEWWRSQPRPDVDLICGGPPCQPVSHAGRRLAEHDDRWMWPAMREVLRLVRPRYAFIENVAGLLTAGLTGILADLADLGFDADWSLVPACAVGAPHMRHRLFVLAHTHRTGLERRRRHDERPRERAAWQGVSPALWLQPPADVRPVADGLPRRLAIHALGNAVVPQVAEHVGRLIVDYDRAAA